jgi:hypothetical protein
MPANPPNGGGVVGTDNIAPIYNPHDRWQTWNIHEIYTGTIGEGKFVPKIDDLVFEISGSSIIRHIVRDIDPSTMIAILQRETLSNTNELTQEDIIFGIGASTPSETYRVYIDKSVVPYKMTVDARNKVYGSMSNYCKIFKGTDTSSNGGLVISRMYDTNNTFLGENIPLETAAYDNLTNYSVKVVAPAFTNANLTDGEIVTVVIYNDQGGVVSRRQMLVINTAFIRSADASKKYVTAVTMHSPFMSPVNDRLLEYPINVPLAGLNLTGRVTYSDGSYREYPVDGTRFSVFGFNGYLATVVGQRINLVLKYNLQPNELSYNLTMLDNAQISELYEATTLNVDGSYNLKLYGYPVWVSDVSGYRLEWFLYNLDRNIKYNVTPFVVINTAFRPFNPTLYGTVQNLNVSLNIQNANSSFKNYIHAQTIDIVLNRRGSERPNNWTVGFSPSQQPRFGVETYATAYFNNVNQWRILVDCGAADYDEWLERMYYRTEPLYDSVYEEAPVVPNWFALVVGDRVFEYPIDRWNSELILNGTIQNNITVYLRFFKRTSDNDLELSIAGLPLYYVNANNVPT